MKYLKIHKHALHGDVADLVQDLNLETTRSHFFLPLCHTVTPLYCRDCNWTSSSDEHVGTCTWFAGARTWSDAKGFSRLSGCKRAEVKR